MKVLMTGATGFIGSHLARKLVQRGHDVHAVTRRESSFRRVQDLEHQINWLIADESGDVDSAGILGVDVVVHASASFGRRGETVTEIVDANVLKPLRLLEAAASHGVRRFINTDSALPRGISPYSLSKAHFARWGRMLAESQGLDFANLRLEHVYGPDDEDIKFVCHVVEACLRNQTELRLTEGGQKRDFIYVEDAVTAFILIIENPGSVQRGYVDIPMGTGHATSVRELVETVQALTKSKTHLLFGALPTRPNEVMYSCADTSMLNALGWMPKVDLREGLSLTIRSGQLS